MKLHGEPMLPPMDMREVDPDEMSGRSGSLFPALVNDIEPLEIELDDDDDEEGECAECDSCGASGGQVHEYYDGLCLCSDCYEETRR
jgi:hypothetical protein